jgi:hypothetical protein
MVLSINFLLLVLSAYTLAHRVTSGRDGLTLFHCALALAPLIIWLVVLPLGALHLLTSLNASALLAVMSAGSLVWHFAGAPEENPGAPEVLSVNPEGPSWRAMLGVCAVTVSIGLQAARLLVRGFSLSVEDSLYHAPFAANAIITGGFTSSSFFYMDYYPFNAELLPLWLTLHAGTDGAAVLAGLFFLFLIATSAAVLARSCGMSTSSGTLLAALLTLTSVVRAEAGRFSSPDLAGPAMVLASIAFLAVYSGDEHRAGRIRSLLMAGLLAGWAIGSKALFLGVPVVICGWLIFRKDDTLRWRERLARASLFSVAAAVTGSYWFVHNVVLTGNPVYPAQMAFFPGPFTSADQWQTSLLGTVVDGRYAVPELWNTVAEYVHWPVAIWILATGGYAGVLLWWPRRKQFRAPAAMRVAALCVLIGGASLLAFPFVPFSGTFDLPDGSLIAVPRYLILPFILGVTAFMMVAGGTAIGYLAGLCAVMLALLEAWGITGPVVCGLLFVIGMWIARSTRMRIPGRPAVAGLLLCLVFGAAPWVKYIAQVADREVFSQKYFDEPRGGCWEALEFLPSGSCITWFGPSNCCYELFGRRYQFVPVAVNGDGTLLTPLHQRSAGGTGAIGWWAPSITPEAVSFISNLQALGIKFVVVQKTGRVWPPQDAILRSAPHSRVRFDDGSNRIIELGR